MQMDLSDQQAMMFQNSTSGVMKRGVPADGRPYRLDRSGDDGRYAELDHDRR